jgi:RHS repeat-associated protein
MTAIGSVAGYSECTQEGLSVSANSNNQLVATGYSYDASGNLLNDGTHSYTYDAESRIVKVDGGSTAAYVYDAEGRRVQKTTAAGTVNYVYDIAGQQVAEVNSSGTLNRAEVYAGGWHLATYTNSTTYFNHADWLGTERMRTGVSGTSCETIMSLPFGDGQATSGSCDPTPMHFTGKERDSESGLDNFDFRYFSSSMGRFMNPDDTEAINSLGNPQGLNLYSYVQNNPTNSVDPDGHDCIYINNDTGKYEGFNSGDCDNSTEEKANSGYYVNGTVNTITTTTGDANGVVTGYNGTSDSGALMVGTFGGTPPSNPNTNSDELNPFAQGVFSQLNQMNLTSNIFKIYGLSVAVGATGGAACYYLCPAATVTTLGIATSPLLPIVPSALEKLQRLGLSLQQATEIVESPASQKLVDNLNNGNINVIQDVGGKLVRITLDPSGQRIISAGYVQARNVANSIASGRFTPQ